MSISSLRKEEERLKTIVSDSQKEHKDLLATIQDLDAQKVKNQEDLLATVQNLDAQKVIKQRELEKTRQLTDREAKVLSETNKQYQDCLRRLEAIKQEKKQVFEDVKRLKKNAEEAKTLATECEARVGEIIEAIEAKGASLASGIEDGIADHKILRLALTDGSHLDIRAGVLRKNSAYFAGLLDHPEMISRDPDKNIFVEGNPYAMRAIFMAMQDIPPPQTETTKLEWANFLRSHPHFIPAFRRVFEGYKVEGLSKHYSKKVRDALTSLYDFLQVYEEAYTFYLILPHVRETVIGKLFNCEESRYLDCFLDSEEISIDTLYDCHLIPLEPGAYTLSSMTHPKMVRAQTDLLKIMYDASCDEEHRDWGGTDFLRAKWGSTQWDRRWVKRSFYSFQRDYSPSKYQVDNFVKDKMMSHNRMTVGFLKGIREGVFVLDN